MIGFAPGTMPMLTKLKFVLTVNKESIGGLNKNFFRLWMVCERNKPSRCDYLNKYASRNLASKFHIGWSIPVWKFHVEKKIT